MIAYLHMGRVVVYHMSYLIKSSHHSQKISICNEIFLKSFINIKFEICFHTLKVG